MINLTVCGISYPYPQTGDANWGTGASNWAIAITAGMLSKAGGSFPLTADANFGTNFGLFAKYLTSISANPSGTGVIRLANADGIGFRNAGNTADILLQPDADGILQYNSIDLVNLSATQTLTNKTISGASNTITGISTSALVTAAAQGSVPFSSGSALSFLTPGVSGQVLTTQGASANPIWTSVVTNPMTTLGDLLYGGASGAATRLAGDTSNTRKFLRELSVSSVATAPVWDTLASGDIPNNAANTSGTAAGLSATLAIASGGTGQVTAGAAFNALAPATAKGGLIAGSGSNTYSNLPVGTDNQVLIASSTATDGVAWTTLQQGAKNYITYNNFENNATTGWSLGMVGTLTNGLPTGNPTFGSGAAGTLSIATVSSGQLAGTYSMSLVSSAATTIGNMVATQAYTIDKEDQAKVLTVKFYYSCPTNGGANFSGTSANTLAWGIWDVTNSVWLSSAGNFNLVQGTGVGYCTGTVQTGATTASLRLVLFMPAATTGATTWYVDDFYVGPQTAPMGPAMSDFVAYTPTFTGFGTVTTQNFIWRRVGASVEIYGSFTTGVPTGTAAQISLPSVTASTALGTNQGVGDYVSNVGASGAFTMLISGGASGMNIGYTPAAGGGYTPVPGTTIAGTGNLVNIHAVFPVQGFSSNSSMSSDTDTRVVAAAVTQSSNTVVTLGSVINLPVVLFDTHGAYNAGSYTVPVSGTYRVSTSGLNYNSTAPTLYLNKNGTPYAVVGVALASGAGGGSTDIQCVAGDVLAIYPGNTDQLNVSAVSGHTIGRAIFTFERLSGPAVIAATESVNANYYTSATTSYGNSTTTVLFSTKVKDSHNAFNTSTGIYTVPVSGTYTVEAMASGSNGSNQGVTQNITINVIQTGSASINRTLDNIYAQVSNSTNNIHYAPHGSTNLNCLAGDTIYFQVTSGFNGGLSLDGSGNTYMTIARVGN